MTRSQQRRQELRPLLVFAKDNDIDCKRLLRWLQSDQVKVILNSWWHCETAYSPCQRSRIQNFVNLVCQKTTSLISSSKGHKKFDDKSNVYISTYVTDGVDVSARAVRRLIYGYCGKWVFVKMTSTEKAILAGARLLEIICLEMNHVDCNGYFRSLLSSEPDAMTSKNPEEVDYRDFLIDSAEEDNSEGSTDKHGEHDAGDEDNDSLNGFVVEDDGEDKIGDVEHDDRPSQPSSEYRRILRRKKKESAQGKFTQTRPARRAKHADYGIFQSSWAYRMNTKNHQEPRDQNKRSSTFTTSIPKRGTYTTPILVDDEQDNDQDFFNDSKPTWAADLSDQSHKPTTRENEVTPNHTSDTSTQQQPAGESAIVISGSAPSASHSRTPSRSDAPSTYDTNLLV